MDSSLYIAGTAMICAIGANPPMIHAAMGAGVNRYQLSRFKDAKGQPVRLAPVPAAVFASPDWAIEECDEHGESQDHALKLALHCLAQLHQQGLPEQPTPLLLAMNEPELQAHCLPLKTLAENIRQAGHAWFTGEHLRSLHSGRAAGIEALDFAYQYLAEPFPESMILGSSDSPSSYTRLDVPEQQGRLLSLGPCDGYAPGEGAAFLRLTSDPEQAVAREGQIIKVHPPGLSDEPGHWFTEEPYRGEGLDQAVKQALSSYAGPPIATVFSSMNGERYWAKEWGVASLRNKERFTEEARVVHPAEYFGDLGSATAPALITLAVEHLFSQASETACLVYSSSDGPRRGAVVLEKQPRLPG
ncbi:hypothetical protein [Marinimicrobium locisalis]|uniref:hypothetical protein n=1 Tax=Marinimicrobium locisalis TaxID=546022 RepID=UPI0032218681